MDDRNAGSQRAVLGAMKRPTAPALFCAAVLSALPSLAPGIAATAALPSAGCGGCSLYDNAATVSPASACLTASASSKQCGEASGKLSIQNACDQAVTLSAAGLVVTSDVVISSNSDVSVDADFDSDPGWDEFPEEPQAYQLSLGGQNLILTVDWANGY